jgi:hypothetical protein
MSDADTLSVEMREALAGLQRSVVWVTTAMRANADAKDKLGHLQRAHQALQDEYKKSQHNLDVTQKMFIQLSEYIKKNCPPMALYDALGTPPEQRPDWAGE